MTEVKLTFLGDLMCQMAQIRAVGRHGSYERVFEQVKDLWADSDYVIGNLETPVTGHRPYAFEEMRFNAPPQFLRAVKAADIDFVTTANNHIVDRGVRGLVQTLDQLDAIGIETTGSYRTRTESSKIFIRKINGVRFAFIACTYDTNAGRKSDMLAEEELWRIDYLHHPSQFLGSWKFAVKRTVKQLVPYIIKRKIRSLLAQGEWSKPLADSFPISDFDDVQQRPFLNNIIKKIKSAKQGADFVIVLPHIGGQYNLEPGPWQLKITDALIAAGADLIVANHAHTPLRCEVRNGVFVAHALGNFCFTPRVGFYNDQCQADYSIVLNVSVDVDSREISQRSFSITKTETCGDGVSIVRPIDEFDAKDVEIVCRRVTGNNRQFGIQKEYAL